MARFRLAYRASFRSQRVCVATRFSIAVDVGSPELEQAEQHERMLRELEHYNTPADVRDLEAVLDRYPDDDTAEIRAVLADRHVHRPEALR